MTILTSEWHQARVVRLVRAQHAVEGDGFVVRRPFPTALPAGHVVLGYPLTGAFDVSGTQVTEGILAVLEGEQLTLTGVAASSEIILLTGQPIGEPVARYGPFVMNTEAELRQAFDDFERGTFGSPTD